MAPPDFSTVPRLLKPRGCFVLDSVSPWVKPSQAKVVLVNELDPPELGLQKLVERVGQHWAPVLISLTAADGDLALGKIDVF